jgi:hypothetical protein
MRGWKDRLTFGAGIAGLIVGASLLAHAQGFPWQTLCGVQPTCSVDFSNPPLTFGRTNGTGGVLPLSNVPIGSVAYGSFGTSTASAAGGDTYLTSISVGADMTVTNINVLQGATVATDKWIGVLYNSAGIVIATSAKAGVITAGANTFLVLPLTAPIAIQGPGRYFVGIQSNGATDTLRLVAASTFIDILSTLTTGVFATNPNITPPTTFTALNAPIVYLN